MPLGNQLTALLKEHISIAGKIRAARGTLLTFTDVWFKNADQIAALLYHLNPQYWSYDEMQKMMHHHLKITTAEVLAVLHGGSGAGAYDKVDSTSHGNGRHADGWNSKTIRQAGVASG